MSGLVVEQQIGGETQEQTELFRSMLALPCVEWTGAGEKGQERRKMWWLPTKQH